MFLKKVKKDNTFEKKIEEALQYAVSFKKTKVEAPLRFLIELKKRALEKNVEEAFQYAVSFKTTISSVRLNKSHHLFKKNREQTKKIGSRKPMVWHTEKDEDRQVLATYMKQFLVQGACMFLECAEGFMLQELCRQGIAKTQMIAVSHAAEEILGLQKKFGPTLKVRHMDVGEAIQLDILDCGSLWIDLYGELVGSTAMYPPHYIQNVVYLFAASHKTKFFLAVTAKKSCRGGGIGRENLILDYQQQAGYKSFHILDMYYFFKFLVKRYVKQYGVKATVVYNHEYGCMRTMAVVLSKD